MAFEINIMDCLDVNCGHPFCSGWKKSSPLQPYLEQDLCKRILIPTYFLYFCACSISMCGDSNWIACIFSNYVHALSSRFVHIQPYPTPPPYRPVYPHTPSAVLFAQKPTKCWFSNNQLMYKRLGRVFIRVKWGKTDSYTYVSLYLSHSPHIYSLSLTHFLSLSPQHAAALLTLLCVLSLKHQQRLIVIQVWFCT